MCVCLTLCLMDFNTCTPHYFGLVFTTAHKKTARFFFKKEKVHRFTVTGLLVYDLIVHDVMA